MDLYYLRLNILLRMSAAGSSLIALPTSVRQRPCRTQLLKRHVGKQNLPLALSRASHGKSVFTALTRARHSYVGHCPRTRGVSVKSVLQTIASEKNGAWSETGKRVGEEKVTRASERMKGRLAHSCDDSHHRKQRCKQTMLTTSVGAPRVGAFEGVRPFVSCPFVCARSRFSGFP